MPGRNLPLKTRHSLRVMLCFLCCALITFGGIVQAGHIHANGQAVQTDCALCHVAQLVVHPAAPQSLPRAVPLIARVSTALQPIRTRLLFVYSLFTRPPPALTAHS